MVGTHILNAQQLDFSKVKNYGHQLDDVMELTDTMVLKIIMPNLLKVFSSSNCRASF